MEIALDFGNYWSVFFVGLVISTIAMSTGIDGAAFWGPALLFFYKLDPCIAVACAIVIELFGFTSGLVGYAARKKIIYKKGLLLVCFSIPFAILGAFLSKIIPPLYLIATLGIGSFFLVYSNILRARKVVKERDPKKELKNKKLGFLLTSIGGIFAGGIGLGLGETNNYYLTIKNKLPSVYATGTTIFMIAITDLFCSIFNAFYFGKYSSVSDWSAVLNILIFAVPSVIIGAQFGVYLAHKFKRHHFNYFVASVLTAVSIFSFYRVVLEVDKGSVMAKSIIETEKN